MINFLTNFLNRARQTKIAIAVKRGLPSHPESCDKLALFVMLVAHFFCLRRMTLSLPLFTPRPKAQAHSGCANVLMLEFHA